MKRSKISVAAVAFAALLFVGITGFTQQAQAQSVSPVTVKSSKDFDGTIAAIKKAASGGGMMILSELNQGKILSMTGLQLHAQSLFIGNPYVGNMAFSADPSVGLVLPVRVNVYEENGKTYVNYYKPSDQLTYSGSEKAKMIGQKLDGKLESMMKMIAQ